MVQAKKQRNTPRKTAPKKQTSKKPPPPERSEIIRLCVTYYQQMAAYHAGFDADSTGDEIAGANEGQLGGIALRSAERALDRLNSISAKGKPLSLAELKAKVSLLRGILKFEHGNHWPEEALDYIEHFAVELHEYFKKNVPDSVVEADHVKS